MEERNNVSSFDFDHDGKLTIHDIGMGLLLLVKTILMGVIVGVIAGGIGGVFALTVSYATGLRLTNDWLIYLLPVAGVVIVFVYHVVFGDKEDKGTNLILSSLSEDEPIPLKKAPEIFVATVLSHLTGASVGREGAALQLGGAIGHNLGVLVRFDDKDKKVMTMCGMSAVFSALFGTPMAAAFFSMEVAAVGTFNYSALLPCVISSIVASNLAAFMGVAADAFAIHVIPEFTIGSALLAGALAILCAFISILLCIVLHQSAHIARKLLPNPWLRVIVGGLVLVGLTYAVGNRYYNGAGMDVIELAFEGEAPAEAFLLKMLFTAISLGVGFKGGEIVPAFYIGATFGSLFAGILGLNPAMGAAIGMGALFCGVTNCPIASLLICFELFGFGGMPYFLIAIALSYTFSGYFSLYSSQKIVYSKIQNKYLNRKTS